MGTHDEMSEERLREELVSFARLVLLLNRKGALLDRSASLLRLLGDLRRAVFSWEVRATDREGPPRPRRPGQPGPLPPDDPSSRIVREALERERELLRELERETLDDEPEGDHL